MNKSLTRLVIGIVLVIAILVVCVVIFQRPDTLNVIPEQVRSELGDRTIDILTHATKVETFKVNNQLSVPSPKTPTVANAVILACGPVESRQYAKGLAAVFLDERDYPDDPVMKPMYAFFGARFVSPAGTVELVTDPVVRHSHLLAFDIYNDKFKDQWIEDIGDSAKLGKLIHDALPDVPLAVASGQNVAQSPTAKRLSAKEAP